MFHFVLEYQSALWPEHSCFSLLSPLIHSSDKLVQHPASVNSSREGQTTCLGALHPNISAHVPHPQVAGERLLGISSFPTGALICTPSGQLCLTWWLSCTHFCPPSLLQLFRIVLLQISNQSHNEMRKKVLLLERTELLLTWKYA